MESKECPGCAMEVEDNMEICPICGYEFPSQPLSLQIMAWVMIVLIILWFIL